MPSVLKSSSLYETDLFRNGAAVPRAIMQMEPGSGISTLSYTVGTFAIREIYKSSSMELKVNVREPIRVIVFL